MTRPRVGIDAHHLSALEGNRSYTVALLRALARAGTSARFELTAYGPENLADPGGAVGLAGDEARALAWGQALPRGAVRRTALAAPLLTRSDRLDLWHASFVAPPFARVPVVLAVHDALALVRPDLFSRAFALRMRLLLPRSIARARRVLVPTETVRADLERLGLGRGKTLVAPIGVDDRVFRPESGPGDLAALGRVGDAEGRASRGLEGVPYVLAVGRADRRKRLPELVRAFARVARAGERLVLAGAIDGRAEERLRGEAARAEERVRREGAHARLEPGALVVVRAPDEATLAALYRGARALAFPSAGEGLGLPVVEALACGTPVIASDLPVFREVAGGAAFALVPERELERDLGDALRNALDLDATGRERLARSGREVAARFSLAAMASLTERAWREVLEA